MLFATQDWIAKSLVTIRCSNANLMRPDPHSTTPLLAAMDRYIDGPGNPDNPDHGDGDFLCVSVLYLLMENAWEDPTSGGCRLHRALRKGLALEEGLRQIADAFSRALVVPDPENGLVPFLLAAARNKARLETVYKLMVRSTGVLASHCAGVITGESGSRMVGTKKKMDAGGGG